MKLEIESNFAFMLSELAKGNNQKIKEYFEELILSEYQKKRFQEQKI